MKPYPSYKPSGVPWLGNVPAHWEAKKLKHVVERIVGGATPSTSEPSLWDDENGTPWVAIGDMSATEFVACTTRKVSDEGLRDKRMEVLPSGTVIYSMYASVGYASILGIDAVTNQAILGMVGQRFNNRFLMSYLNSIRVSVLQEAASNTQDNLNAEKVRRIPVLCPPTDEQQTIADYLETETARINELIREKDELITLLREWRQTVIADFTAGVSQPGVKKPTGNVHLPQIPADWTMVRLGKYARIGNGSTPLKDNTQYWEGGTFPWLNSAVVNQDEVREGSEYVTEEALRACHLPIVEPDSLLVALTGQGKTRGQVTILRIQATINQHLAYLDLDREHFDENYLFWTLTGMYAALRMVSDGQGGTKGALTCEDLSRFEVPKPLLSEQKQIALRLSAETAKIDDLITHTSDEITLLKELRAATIADAVFGRVDVRTIKQ